MAQNFFFSATKTKEGLNFLTTMYLCLIVLIWLFCFWSCILQLLDVCFICSFCPYALLLKVFGSDDDLAQIRGCKVDMFLCPRMIYAGV